MKTILLCSFLRIEGYKAKILWIARHVSKDNFDYFDENIQNKHVLPCPTPVLTHPRNLLWINI